jgi:hypothetical protein
VSRYVGGGSGVDSLQERDGDAMSAGDDWKLRPADRDPLPSLPSLPSLPRLPTSTSAIPLSVGILDAEQPGNDRIASNCV